MVVDDGYPLPRVDPAEMEREAGITRPPRGADRADDRARRASGPASFAELEDEF